MSPRKLIPLAFIAGLPVCACSSSATSSGVPASETPQQVNAQTIAPFDAFAVRTALHDAFQDEAQWSRFYLVRALASGPDAGAVKTRLMASEDAIPAVLQPIYGDAFRDQLGALLHERANGLVAIVLAVQGSSTPTINLRGEWMSNANSIAQLIGRAMPVSLAELQSELQAESQAVLDEVDAYSNARWRDADNAYLTASSGAVAVSEYLSTVMATQFASRIAANQPDPGNASLHLSLRQLFDDNAFWVHSTIISHLTNSADEPYVVDEAAMTTTNIGSQFVPFYSPDVGNMADYLFHAVTITDAYAYMLAASSNDAATASALRVNWVRDANNLTLLLSNESAVWLIPSLEGWLRGYIAQTATEIDQRLASNWQAEINAYDTAVTSERTFAYSIADGFYVHQLPITVTSAR